MCYTWKCPQCKGQPGSTLSERDLGSILRPEKALEYDDGMTSLKETPCGDRNLGILAGDQSGLEMEVGVLLSVTVPRDLQAWPYLTSSHSPFL